MIKFNINCLGWSYLDIVLAQGDHAAVDEVHQGLQGALTDPLQSGSTLRFGSFISRENVYEYTYFTTQNVSAAWSTSLCLVLAVPVPRVRRPEENSLSIRPEVNMAWK